MPTCTSHLYGTAEYSPKKGPLPVHRWFSHSRYPFRRLLGGVVRRKLERWRGAMTLTLTTLVSNSSSWPDIQVDAIMLCSRYGSDAASTAFKETRRSAQYKSASESYHHHRLAPADTIRFSVNLARASNLASRVLPDRLGSLAGLLRLYVFPCLNAPSRTRCRLLLSASH